MDRHRTGFGQGCNFRNWLKDKGLRPLMDRMDIKPPAPSLSQWFLRVYPQDLETTGCRTGVSAHEARGPRNIYPTPHLAICSSHRHREYAHCTGAWRTGTGGYALVPGFINGAPRIRLPLIDAPPPVGAAKGTGAHRCSAHWFTAHRYSAGVYTAQCMHTGQCVQCIHCTVCTYSVQCIHCTV